MSLLLTELADFLITESGLQHLLIEPVSVSASAFPSRFSGIAVIYGFSDFWELDLGRGPIKSQQPKRLEEIALRAGASRIEYR